MSQLPPARDLRPVEASQRRRWSGVLSRIAWPVVGPRLGLSPRETEIARALLVGATVAGAAFALGISQGTVKTHLRRIYRKLAIDCRCELLLCLLAAGEASGRPGGGAV